MPSQSKCVFEFDRPEPVYYSGEVINGQVTLNTRSTKAVNEVFILFEGRAKITWTRNVPARVGTPTATGYNTKRFTATEKYINSRTVLHGTGELLAGKHTYTYSIPLPLKCPTSCKKKYGHISYVLSLVIDRSWPFNKVYKQSITVLQTFNLNLHPECLIPLRLEDIKRVCCWPCSSGSIFSRLTIPIGGYVPGQDINYKLEIDNQSSGYDLNGITFELKQIYHFWANSPEYDSRELSKIVAKIALKESILRLTKRVLTGSITIPPLPPSSQKLDIISIDYRLIMTIKTGYFHLDTKIEIPFKIGTIPFMQSVCNASPAYSRIQDRTATLSQHSKSGTSRTPLLDHEQEQRPSTSYPPALLLNSSVPASAPPLPTQQANNVRRGYGSIN